MIETLAGAALAADSLTIGQDDDADSLQAHFHAGIAADEIEQVFHLKRAQPTLQAFTALFHGGADGVLSRLLVLRELEENRRFLLLVYASNPALLAGAEPRIRALFESLPSASMAAHYGFAAGDARTPPHPTADT